MLFILRFWSSLFSSAVKRILIIHRTSFFVKKTALISAFLLLSGSLYAGISFDDTGWQLSKSDQRIRVYSLSIDGSDMDAVKGETTVNAPLDRVLSVFLKSTDCQDWLHDCSNYKVLKDNDDENRQIYFVHDFPWPITDRDYILDVEEVQNPNEVVLHIVSDNDALPSKSGFIRGGNMEGSIRLTPSASNKKTKVTWMLHIEVGDGIPKVLANSHIIDMMHGSLMNLSKSVKLERYKNLTDLSSN